MEIKITRDTMSDTYFDALRIRNEVFVKEQGVPYELEVENALEEATSIHFVSYDNSLPVATVRLLITDSLENALVQRMAVLPDFRGQGLGVELLESLIDFAQTHGYKKLTLHAQLTARGFYPHFGFIEVGEIFEEAGIQHITMEKAL